MTPVPPRPTPLIPTYEALPSPSAPIELADQPLTNTLTVTDRGPPAADLEIQVLGPIQVVPGETTIYTLTVRNDGPAPATGIVLSDVLPQGVTPVLTQPAQPWCGRQGRNVSCDLGDLRESAAATVTLDLSVDGTQTLSTDTQLAGVALDLSAPTCATDRDPTQPHVTCRLANLQPGADAHIRIGVGVDAPITGSLVHTASVTANEADPNRSNNQATFSMTVGAAGAAALTAHSTTDLAMQANGPSSVTAGQPFTYTFTITNRGERDATGVRFEDVVPSDMNLLAYAPGLPLCEQRDDTLTCTLRDPETNETLTFTLVITGHGGQPMKIGLDPLMPGWPFCFVVKEQTWQHVVHCELGVLKPGQAAHVQMVLVAIGVLERTTANTASVSANEAELNPLDNTNTATMTVQVEADLED